MRPSVALLLSTLLWGGWGLANKRALVYAHLYTVQWMYSIPYLLAIPIWYSLAARAGHGGEFNLVAFGWAAAGGLASVFAVYFVFVALQTVEASIAVTITAAYPLVTLLLAIMLREEQLTGPKLLGTVLIIAGIIVLQGRG